MLEFVCCFDIFIKAVSSIMYANLHDIWQDLFVSMLNAVSVHYLFDAAFVSMLNAVSVHYLFDAANTSIQQWMFTFVFNKCSKLKKRILFLLVWQFLPHLLGLGHISHLLTCFHTHTHISAKHLITKMANTDANMSIFLSRHTFLSVEYWRRGGPVSYTHLTLPTNHRV